MVYKMNGLIDIEQLSSFATMVGVVTLCTNVIASLFRLQAKYVGLVFSLLVVYSVWLNQSEFTIIGAGLALLNSLIVYSSAVGVAGMAAQTVDHKVPSRSALPTSESQPNQIEETILVRSTGWRQYFMKWF